MMPFYLENKLLGGLPDDSVTVICRKKDKRASLHSSSSMNAGAGCSVWRAEESSHLPKVGLLRILSDPTREPHTEMQRCFPQNDVSLFGT